PGLRTGEFDHPAPRRHGGRRPRALHAPSCPPARAADAPALPRRRRSPRPFRIARRGDVPQRPLPPARSTGRAPGDRPRAAPGRARGAARAAGRPARDAPGLRADLVVCTGDLTQLAMEEEFALAQGALAPLGDRLICIPGNHDRYPLAGRPNRLYESYFPPRPLPERFAALDSCGEICWPVITQGRIRESELKQDFRGKLVLIHHAPFRTGGVPDWPWP